MNNVITYGIENSVIKRAIDSYNDRANRLKKRVEEMEDGSWIVDHDVEGKFFWVIAKIDEQLNLPSISPFQLKLLNKGGFETFEDCERDCLDQVRKIFGNG